MNINNLLSIKLILFIMFSSNALAELSSERKQQLSHLLKHDCGSCHGMTLKGGLGPALLPANLKQKDDEYLLLTIQHGRPGTPMPPWKALLTADEIHFIIKLLRSQPE